jgi:DNA-binding NarL/FixJ family response regulator
MPCPPIVRVLLVDDFEAFRRFIRTTLDAPLQVVGEASDGLEAVQKAKQLQPDLILLDIALPGLNGIEAARQIRKLSPRSKILFLSQESSADVVEEALKFGAGYIVKAQAGGELAAVIEAMRAAGQFATTVGRLTLVPTAGQSTQT